MASVVEGKAVEQEPKQGDREGDTEEAADIGHLGQPENQCQENCPIFNNSNSCLRGVVASRASPQVKR